MRSVGLRAVASGTVLAAVCLFGALRGGPVLRAETAWGVERELAAGQTHDYTFYLEADHYLELVVVQDGIDVVLGIYGPDGHQLGTFDSPTQSQGPEPARLVAERTGTHRLEVATAYRRGEAGRYRIERVVLRPATVQDRHRHLYEQAKLERHRLDLNHLSASEWHRAQPLLERMIHHARLGRDLPAEAMTWGSLAGNYYGQGEWLAALETARGARELWRQAGDPGMEAYTDGFIGFIYAESGELQKALDYFDGALKIAAAAENPRWKAYMFAKIVKIHVAFGDDDKAIEFLEQALEIWRTEGLLDLWTDTLTGLGQLHAAQGRFEVALDFYEEALPLTEANDRWDAKSSVLTEMAWVLACLGREQAARQAFDRARARIGLRSGPKFLYHHFRLAQIHEVLDGAEAALAGYRAALVLYTEVNDTRFRAQALYEIARLEGRRGQLHEAQAAIEEAVGLIESHRGVVGGRRLQALYLASQHDYYELQIETLMRLAVAEPRSGHAARAFAAHERSRARSLLEGLGESRYGLRRGLDPALAARERELRARLRDAVLSEVRADSSTDPATLTDLLAQQAELMDRIRVRGLEASERIRVPTLTLAEVQDEVLDDETLLLEYALGEERGFLWAVTSTSVSIFELPGRDEIEEDVRAVYKLLTARAPDRFETEESYRTRVEKADAAYPMAMAKLSRMLLLSDRLAGAGTALPLSVRRIVVVGEGALQYLPFAALPIPGTTTPLGFAYEMTSAPSASVICALRRRPARIAPRKTLAMVADPAFTTEGNGRDRQLSEIFPLERSLRSVGLAGLEPLPGARREAESILDLVEREQSLEALGFAASRETVTSGALADYRFVHFATHALLNSRHPDLSGIVLSLVDEEGRPQDGFLRLHDVYDLDLAADLVVLSACQTALGQEIRGEGLVGLTRGFLHAGAPAVVASLWSPDDDATAELMRHFYDGMLRRGLSPAAALREAQMAIAAEAKWRSPFYWAAFVLQGDWRWDGAARKKL